MENLKDFYPTPLTIIYKMLAKADISNAETILEPSAGKGDIAEALKRQSEDRTAIDVIEINPDMQHILRGKGFNLIHDDFLTFDSNAKYDVIVANFPFSEGDKHLQKAIQLLEKHGGRLVCLVNAETIKNAYTNLRQALLKKLSEYNAEIEYIENAFIDAERKTGVEVALINLFIPTQLDNSLILDNLKKAQEFNFKTNVNEQIIEKDFIKALISRYNFEAQAGIRLIKEYAALTPFIQSSFKGEEAYSSELIELKIYDGHGSISGDNIINKYLQVLRRKYWNALVSNKEFFAKYTSNLQEMLYEKIDELKKIEFSLFNIEQLKIDLNKQVINGIDASILKLFDELSHKHYWSEENNTNIHYYNGWKTNKAYKINSKVILPINGFSSWGYKNKLETYGDFIKKMIDMVKVFNYFENKVSKPGGEVMYAINTANEIKKYSNINFYYFDATFYKKGTCHLVFKNKELLDKFNIYGSRMRGWLPPAYGKKHYNEMTEEEQTVVDNFQGSIEYENVMLHKEKYIIDPNKLYLN